MTLTGTKMVFFGSPAFAVPSLKGLVAAGAQVLVVTMPDRPKGRQRVPTPPPVKVAADALGLTTWQPEKLDAEFRASLEAWGPDVAVVAAYGKIFRPTILAIPRHGFVNVHPSLLPRHRGASPIPATILAGDTITGVSIMVLDEGMDTGALLTTTQVALSGTETTDTLTETLAELGAKVLLDVLPKYLNGTAKPKPQRKEGATVTAILHKDDGRIPWQQSAQTIARHIRAMTSWPGAWTLLGDQRMKILTARVGTITLQEAPGTILPFSSNALSVQCGESTSLEITCLQSEGKKPVAEKDLRNGYQEVVGKRFT